VQRLKDYTIATGSTRQKKYFEYIDARRSFLLKVLLVIFITIAAIFIPVNISLGDWPLAYVEMGVIVFSICLLHYLRKPQYLSACSYAFVFVGALWSVIASCLPSSDYTIFVWNAYVPALSFFLLGKKTAISFCRIYLPVIIGIFLYRHFYTQDGQPLEVALNLVLYMLFISVLYMYYESTRAHTEKMLVDDIVARIKTENENTVLISNLREALAEVKSLSGLLPVCSCCKKIRDDKGYWNKLEVFIEERSEAQFSHGMCPDCAQELYPDVNVDFEAVYQEEFPSWSEEEQKNVNDQQALP